MKLFTLVLIMVLGLAQFSQAQEKVQPSNQNAMSNVIAVTAQGGITYGITDYSNNNVDYIGTGSLEYYIPSSGRGNLGVRIFGQKGFITGLGAPASAGNSTNEFSTRIDLLGGGAFYTFSIADIVYPRLEVGISNLWFFPENSNGNKLPNQAAGNYATHMLAYNGDVGLRVMISNDISVNVSGGMIVGTNDFLDDIKASSDNDMVITATAGVSYYFGRNKDSDGDGVSDSKDMCPDTPAGVKVDDFGCPLDGDGDGVADYLDKCPGTPAGVKVDEYGCPLDTDGDGVADYLDKCSGTPAGVKVDMYGCPLDTDGDGVPDYLDKCTDTPSGVKVDAKGCPLDTDGDGVPDYRDKCSNTPKGVSVDTDGCPIEKDTVVVMEPGKVVVLSGDTNFEFNKAKLLPSAYSVLQPLVATMKANPNYKWEVDGYTDGVGSASYNLKLSEKRAQSVVDYLVSNGVSRKSLKIVGYGKDNPVATNATDEGRAMNRRVEIKLISKN